MSDDLLFGHEGLRRAITMVFLAGEADEKTVRAVADMLAGEPERAARQERLAQGVPLAAAAWQGFVAAGESLGLAAAMLEHAASEV